MNPKPFWPLNHLTVPVVMGAFLHRRVKSSRALTQPVNSRFWEQVVSQARRSRRGQVVRPKTRLRSHIALLLHPQFANGVYLAFIGNLAAQESEILARFS